MNYCFTIPTTSHEFTEQEIFYRCTNCKKLCAKPKYEAKNVYRPTPSRPDHFSCEIITNSIVGVHFNYS